MNVRRLCAWLVVAATAASSSAPLEADRQSPALSEPAHAGALPIDVVTRPWLGDFDGIVQRRLLRLLTPYSRTHYFVDRGVQRGMAYDFGMRLEQEINRRLKTTAATKVHVVFVPTARDQLYQSLIDGRGDVIASNLVVTPDSARLVDFTIPGQVNVNEILVTGPGTRALDRLDQLAGLVLHPKVVARGNASIAWAVRKSSPKLLDALNPIVEANRVGTGFGNTVLRAHLRGARQLEPNVHAGVKYVRVLIDRYFQGEPTDPLNKTLFAFAAYNCGPGRLGQLRRQAQRRGLNPHVWFNNVESMAGDVVGRQTVEYVSSIYKYYVAYKLAAEASSD